MADMTVRTTIPVPPLGGFTIDDLADLDLPPHTQLIHGGLFVNASPQTWHNLLVSGLAYALKQAATDAVVIPDMAVRLADNHAPEPDIVVVPRKAAREDANSYPPDVVLLAVEVMSSDQRKDRVVRPDEYATAGIPCYWRIERTPAREYACYTYALDPVNAKYVLTGRYLDHLKTDEPWPLEADLRALATP